MLRDEAEVWPLRGRRPVGEAMISLWDIDMLDASHGIAEWTRILSILLLHYSFQTVSCAICLQSAFRINRRPHLHA